MRLSAELFDRRWFWILVMPVMLYWLVPWKTNNAFLLNLHRSSLLLNLALVTSLLLFVWLALRERLFDGVPPVGENWWLSTLLDLLKGTFFAFLSLIVGSLMGKIYDRNSMLAYSLQVAAVLTFGYAMWRIVYLRDVKKS